MNALSGLSGLSGLVAPSFAGAYDAIPSIAAAYGMRRLRTAYTGSLLRLRRSSDNTEQNIGYTADGHLDTAAVAAFVGGGSGYIVTWYDQSGNGYNATQTTAASQPLYVASGQNGRPVGRWDGSNDFLEAAMAWGTNANLSICAVNKSVATNLFKILTSLTNSGNVNSLYEFSLDARTPNNYYVLRRSDSGTIKQLTATPGGFGTWTALSAVSNGITASMWEDTVNRINGGDVSVGTTTLDWLGIGRRNASTTAEFYQGDIAELIICNAALSDANRQAAEAAANAYWAVY